MHSTYTASTSLLPLFNNRFRRTRPWCCTMSKGCPPRNESPPRVLVSLLSGDTALLAAKSLQQQGLISIFVGVSVTPSYMHPSLPPSMNDDTAQARRHAGSRSMISVPDRGNIPVARYLSDAERVEGERGVLMCQLIARKLERIALNDGADGLGLKAERRRVKRRERENICSRIYLFRIRVNFIFTSSLISLGLRRI